MITGGSKWRLFGFVLLLFAINVLGFFCLIVGLLVTLPVTLAALGYVYRRLSAQTAATVTA